ncbi:MAG TPA: ATP-grasp domain-containing protein [Polyangiaceae bacterium]|nr:ATP-grasp domain-containing protein [Polyangiaceae bacterium]
MSLILFPSEPFSPRSVDPDFEHELAAARQSGLSTALVDHTRVLQGAAAEAVARTPDGPAAAIYRGWMLTPDQYRSMHGALSARGITLINTPEAYRTCHYLPDSYPFIENRTPRSVWVPVRGSVDFDALRQALAPFHHAPLVVKDYVKSQKHYWTEACFIPAADDPAAVERVVKRFLELQGEDLNEGLVFREFVPLKIVGEHPKSRLPLAAEFRTFWLDGELILAHRYWGDLTTFSASLPLDELKAIVSRIPSRFFTVDVAFRDDGDWTIVELGDGQVAGLPAPDLAPEFFKRIADTP